MTTLLLICCWSQLRLVQSTLEKQIEKQKAEIESLRTSLQHKIKEAVENKIKEEMYNMLKESIRGFGGDVRNIKSYTKTPL